MQQSASCGCLCLCSPYENLWHFSCSFLRCLWKPSNSRNIWLEQEVLLDHRICGLLHHILSSFDTTHHPPPYTRTHMRTHARTLTLGRYFSLTLQHVINDTALYCSLVEALNALLHLHSICTRKVLIQQSCSPHALLGVLRAMEKRRTMICWGRKRRQGPRTTNLGQALSSMRVLLYLMRMTR